MKRIGIRLFKLRAKKPDQDHDQVRRIVAIVDEAQERACKTSRTVAERRREIECARDELHKIVSAAAARAACNEA